MAERTCIHDVVESRRCGYCDEMPHNQLRREVPIAVAAAYERCAELADAEAERIKHTSHKDGLGMGDQYAEAACARIAATIRSLDEARK